MSEDLDFKVFGRSLKTQETTTTTTILEAHRNQPRRATYRVAKISENRVILWTAVVELIFGIMAHCLAFGYSKVQPSRHSGGRNS